MTKSIDSNKCFFALLFVLLSQFAATNASATAQIMGVASNKGIKVTSCVSCHTSNNGSKSNLKPNYLTAYKLDQAGLTRLKNLINGCSATQMATPTFQCVVPRTVSGAVGITTTGVRRTDVYAVTCGAGTSNLSVAVKDLAPVKAPTVSIQAVKSAAASTLSTDSKDGDAIFSPTVKLAKGAGVYNMQINKSASSVIGAELYTAKFVCLSAAGAKTATSAAVIKQNQ